MKTLFLIPAFLIATLFGTASIYAQTQEWAVTYNHSTVDRLENTVVDNSGNVFVSGEGWGAGFSSYPQQYLAKYNSTGGFQWQRFFTGPYANLANHRGTYCHASVCDNSGNVYIAGSTDSVGGSIKGYIMKYSPSGDSIWGKYAGINDTLGYADWKSMKIDADGNIYLAGINYKLVTYAKSYMVAKYNSTGVLQWMKLHRPANIYDVYNMELALDITNNIFISSSLMKTSSSASVDFYTFKLNNSGVLQWENYYNGPADEEDIISSMTLDALGNVYVEGIGKNITPIFGELTCVKINGSTGAQQWIYKVSGTGSQNDYAFKIAAGSSNAIYLTGSLYSLETGDDGVLIKLNASTGVEAWRKTLKGLNSSYDQFTDVKEISSGIVYAAGAYNWGNFNAIGEVIKYNTAGDSLSSVSYSPGNTVSIRNIIPSLGNSLYIAGDNSNSSASSDIFVVKYSVMTGIEPVVVSSPDKFSLSQNYPNPFNPTTRINFVLAQDLRVTLNIFDVTGKMVETLVSNKAFSSGTHEVEFNGANLSSGTYYYQIKAGNFVETKKMVLVK